MLRETIKCVPQTYVIKREVDGSDTRFHDFGDSEELYSRWLARLRVCSRARVEGLQAVTSETGDRDEWWIVRQLHSIWETLDMCLRG